MDPPRKRTRDEPIDEIEPCKRTRRKNDKKAPSRGFQFHKIEGEDLVIKKVETSKDKIEQPRLAKDPRKIIPSLGNGIIINGKSGSGKSTLLANYITGPQFFGKSPEKPNGWFDEVFLFSPTASGDDIQQSLGIKKEHVYTDLDEAPELIQVILKCQKAKLAGGNKADKVGQYAVIFDDVIGDTKFMNTKEFLQTFYMVRHCNCTTFICSQHYKKVPKVCRLQASFIHFFAGSASEVEQIVEDFAPPQYSKNEFRDLVNEATMGDHDFFTICMKVGWKYRFRKNLNEFISLPRLENGEDDTEAEKGTKTSDRKEPSEKAKICEKQSKSFREAFRSAVEYYKRKNGQNEQTNRGLGQ
jgi:hypothetical protein